MEAVASLVPAGSVVADIGTDHAQLPIALVKRGICPKACAADIAEGPLQTARTNIAREGLQDRIATVLSDGFKHIPSDADCAVIAGMGFFTAAHILEEASDRLPALKRIIVQVNNEAVRMRRWISEHKWEIVDERYVRERGKDYEVIAFRTAAHIPYTESEIRLGPCLMKQKGEEWLDYLRRQYDKAKRINALRRECAQPADEDLVQAERILEEYLGV